MMSEKKGFKQGWLLVAAGVVLVVVIALILLIGLDISAKPKIGFVMTGAADDAGWNGLHYSGVSSACERLDAELLIEENVQEGTGQCAEAIHRLAEKGAQMIVLSSFGYPSEASDAISAYPNIAFYAISSEQGAGNLTSYFGRVYQVRYLSGIIAGMQTENDIVGYVAAMSNSEVNRGINAFALGVKSVNPEAEVRVVFTGTWDGEQQEQQAAQRLIDELKADVLTYHQNRHTVAATADEAGVYSIGYNERAQGLSDKYLTAAVWNWDKLYFSIVREFMMGSANTSRLHWYGIDTGIVCLSEYSPLVTEQARSAVAAAENALLLGDDVFTGIIYDNEGNQRCGEDERLSDGELFNNMDWYVDGVVIYE